MVVLDAFGARWVLDVSGLEHPLAAHLEHLWDRAVVTPRHGPDAGDTCPPFVVRRTSPGWVEVDGNAQRAADPEVPYLVSRHLTNASIARRAGSCVLLHAAGVAAGDGGTVALVAASGTGKTTAARVLGAHLGYVSDETVAVEHDLTVRAHPKPLSIVVDPRSPADKSEQSPDDLGLRRAPGTLRLAAVVVLERHEDAGAPTLEPIGLIEAMQVVLAQTSALPRLDRPLDRLARALAAGCGTYRLRYRDIADCVDLVGDLAHGRDVAAAPEPVTWTWVDGTGQGGEPGPAPHDLGLRSTVSRTAFRDAVVTDDGVLLMRDRRPVTLPGLAATLWLAAERLATVTHLVDAATERLGPSDGAQAAVLATTRALLDAGVLRAG